MDRNDHDLDDAIGYPPDEILPEAPEEKPRSNSSPYRSADKENTGKSHGKCDGEHMMEIYIYTHTYIYDVYTVYVCMYNIYIYMIIYV